MLKHYFTVALSHSIPQLLVKVTNYSNNEAFKIIFFNLVYFIIFITLYFCKYSSLLFSGKYIAIQEKKRITHKTPQLKTQKLLKYMK